MQQPALERDSRFELLRLTAILFVVAHHVLLFGADVCGYLTPYDPHTKGILGLWLNSVFVTGVNLFVMISGWFGIRKVWQPLVRLTVECAIFGAIALGLCILLYNVFPVKGADPHWSLWRLWQSVKFTNWWFIVHYMMLVLSAPILERMLSGIDGRTLLRILVCLVVLNFVFGYWWEYLNDTGYNVLQFIFLYVIARAMRLYMEPHCHKLPQHYIWICIALCVIALSLSANYREYWPAGILPSSWRYNCPVVVLESVAIFMLFMRINLRSAIVNRTASCILGVYLIQSAPALIPYRNALGHWMYAHYGWLGFIAATLLLFIGSLAISAAISIPLRRWVWRKILATK